VCGSALQEQNLILVRKRFQQLLGLGRGINRYTYNVFEPPNAASTASHEHAVQLFDTHASAAIGLAQFVTDGFARGEQVVLITRLANWNRAAVDLARRQIPLSGAIHSGQLVVCDSTRMLDALLTDGWPSADRFEHVIGGLVHEAVERGAGLRAYGDMVDLLAAEGSFEAAERVEELWNELRHRIPFTLFCGYTACHFDAPRSLDALRRIRFQHSHERRGPDDLVANQLMDTAAQSV
jgi:hypothetical protein